MATNPDSRRTLSGRLRSAGKSGSRLHVAADTRRWVSEWNKDPKPFVWAKTADETLATLAAYCQRVSGSGR